MTKLASTLVSSKITHICILGGTGFVGRHLVGQLARAGKQIQVLTRRPADHRELRVLPTVQVVEASIHNEAALEKQFRRFFAGHEKHSAVINLVGILNESGRLGRRFRDAHVALPQTIVNACRNVGIRRLLQMSALHADAELGPSSYLRSKGEGEAVVREANGLDVTVFRPSVIFGSDDSFFNRFAGLLAISPVIFPLACAQARFAPVFVEDVASAFSQALENPKTFGQAYDLCGPKTYSLRELVAYTARLSGRRRLIIGLGKRLSWLQGLIMEWLPGKPFSRDNYYSTQVDSVCESGFPQVFEITPRSVESVVPGYLGSRDPNARFDNMRRRAARD